MYDTSSAITYAEATKSVEKATGGLMVGTALLNTVYNGAMVWMILWINGLQMIFHLPML